MENAVGGAILTVITVIIFINPYLYFRGLRYLKLVGIKPSSKAKTLFREEGRLIEQNQAENARSRMMQAGKWRSTVADCGINNSPR